MMDFKLEPVQFTLLTYYCIINITAAVLTVTDKRRAQKKQWRVPERTLLLLGAANLCRCRSPSAATYMPAPLPKKASASSASKKLWAAAVMTASSA